MRLLDFFFLSFSFFILLSEISCFKSMCRLNIRVNIKHNDKYKALLFVSYVSKCSNLKSYVLECVIKLLEKYFRIPRWKFVGIQQNLM